MEAAASRRTSSPVDVLAPRHLLRETVRRWHMAKKDSNVRYTINLRCAFGDLLPKLKHAYGQPAHDAAESRSQHTLALLAIAEFLERIGPEGDLAHFADQFVKLAQALRDLDDGIRAPILTTALANRGDQSVVWIARAHVALAVETLRRCGHHRSRKSAAKWAAKRHPGLKQLISENAVHRSHDIEKAMISWCEDFSSGKVKNHYAAHAYSVSLNKLKAWAPNCNRDQMEHEADKLLQKALRHLT